MYICIYISFMEKQMNKINTSLALLFISISGAVFAQDIEEIIVTANKRANSSRDTYEYLSYHSWRYRG